MKQLFWLEQELLEKLDSSLVESKISCHVGDAKCAINYSS